MNGERVKGVKVVMDKNIPFVQEVLGPYADVIALEPESITPNQVRDADALIIRTRTKADAALLDGSRVQFIATATIGFDHIDTEYCQTHGIAWSSCPGCNAQAVCDYIEECLCELSLPKDATIGIVGVGHVGTLVAQMAERKGYHILLNDPPKQIGKSIGEIADKCDLITFHTPLTKDGIYPTYHLCDENFLRRCKFDAIIINAARGGVVDEQALLACGHPFVLDTWENEPHIRPQVLQAARLASYHIAGYSVQGKINASAMCLDAFCKHFGTPILSIDKKVVSLHAEAGDSAPGWIQRISEQLKNHPTRFEQLRKQYKLR